MWLSALSPPPPRQIRIAQLEAEAMQTKTKMTSIKAEQLDLETSVSGSPPLIYPCWA